MSLALSRCADPSYRSPPKLPRLEEPEQAKPAPVFPPPPGSEAWVADSWYADCSNGMRFALADLIPSIALAMERQEIPYGRAEPDEWRDCSGSFLRLSSYLASACPDGQPYLPAPPGIADFVRGSDNAVHIQPLARSSRDLAQWFYGQGRMTPVWYEKGVDAEVSIEPYRQLIKPGAVLWFSDRPPREEDGLLQLFGRSDRGTQIRHMGTVVTTEIGEDGEVVSYTMFHGRNAGKLATITEEHELHPGGGRPPFGNGGDYLAAIGSLLPLADPEP